MHAFVIFGHTFIHVENGNDSLIQKRLVIMSQGLLKTVVMS